MGSRERGAWYSQCGTVNHIGTYNCLYEHFKIFYSFDSTTVNCELITKNFILCILFSVLLTHIFVLFFKPSGSVPTHIPSVHCFSGRPKLLLPLGLHSSVSLVFWDYSSIIVDSTMLLYFLFLLLCYLYDNTCFTF